MHTNLEILRLGDLTAVDRKLWSDFQALDPSIGSPYFSVGYADAVDAARPGVRVLRFYQNGRPAAYWPFRIGALGTARPIAGPMDDLHGIIAHPSVRLDLQDPVISKHIGGYAFTAVPFSQRRHGLNGQSGDGNQVIDLSAGYEPWLDARSQASSNFRRERRKVEKLLGQDDVLIHHDLIDQSSFNRLIELKREAYDQSGYFDLFSLAWPKDLLLRLLESNDDNARGILSTLSIAGEVAAICYCMRSQTTLHYWFPAYEAKFAKQKPGLALLFSLAEWATAEGIGELHLGLGDTQYKRQLASWMAPVRSGALAVSTPQKWATGFTRWGNRTEGQNRFSSLAAKSARKYERIALSGSWRA